MLLWTRWNHFRKHQPKLFSRSPIEYYGKVFLKNHFKMLLWTRWIQFWKHQPNLLLKFLKQFIKVRVFIKKSFKLILWTRWDQFWKHQPKLFSRSPIKCYGKVFIKKSLQNISLDMLKSVLKASSKTFFSKSEKMLW